jgi:hypothetical protein
MAKSIFDEARHVPRTSASQIYVLYIDFSPGTGAQLAHQLIVHIALDPLTAMSR